MGRDMFFDQIRKNDTVFVADTARVLGNIKLADNVSIWYGAVIRGDIARIEIGEDSNVQDNAVIHVNYDQPVILGRNVTVGHGAIIHGAIVGDNCLIGMNAVVLDGVAIGKNCIIAAGAVVPPNTHVPEGSMVVGVPGKVVRQLTLEMIERITRNAQEYIVLAKEYMRRGQK